jgi:MoaA/NifB/PqqE/SkfB family radical SAM enzyme
MTDLVNIKSTKNENLLKKETASNWQSAESNNMELQNFDFTKKIFFHPEKIVEYKDGKRPFPITIEVDLTNRCNHRCSFCNYAEHIGIEADKPSLDSELIKRTLREAKELGTKGISFTGGGESTIHKDYLKIIEYAHNIGLDIGTITNGSTITERNVDEFLENLQWIRFSMAGGDRESYKKVQGVDQFELIIKNIELLSKRKQELNRPINIGIRTLVTSDNVHTLVEFANRIKSLNINYYQLAPDEFTTDKGKFWNSENTQKIFKNIKEILTANGINLLTTTFMKSQENLDYPQTCHAHFFMIAILAEGDVTFCKNARTKDSFHIGNIYKQTLKEIWASDKNKEIEKWVKPNNCELFCKHMAINNTLEDTLNPGPNDSPNFIG